LLLELGVWKHEFVSHNANPGRLCLKTILSILALVVLTTGTADAYVRRAVGGYYGRGYYGHPIARGAAVAAGAAAVATAGYYGAGYYGGYGGYYGSEPVISYPGYYGPGPVIGYGGDYYGSEPVISYPGYYGPGPIIGYPRYYGW
jgi:hypothetical protein